MADRNVTFKLGAEIDPAGTARLKAFKQHFDDAYKSITDQTPFKVQITNLEDYNKRRAAIIKAHTEAIRAYTRSAADVGLKDQKVTNEHYVRLSDIRFKAEQALERGHTEFLKRERGRRLSEQKKAEEQEREQGRKSLGERRDKFVQQKETLGGDRDAAVEKTRVKTLQLRDALGGAAASAMQVARGLVLMGVAGEKDVTKVMQAVLKVQSAIDLLSGGVMVIKNLSVAWASYTAMIHSANAALAANKALNALIGSPRMGGGRTGPGGGGSGAGGLAGAIGGGLGYQMLSKINPGVLLGQAPTAYGANALAGSGIRGAIGRMGMNMGFKSAGYAGANIAAGFGGRAGLAAIPVVGQMAAAGLAGYEVGNALSDVSGATTFGAYLGKSFGATNGKNVTRAEQSLAIGQGQEASRTQGIDQTLAKRAQLEQSINAQSDRSNTLRIASAKSALNVTGSIEASEQKIFGMRQAMGKTTNANAKIYLASQIAAQESLQIQLGATKEIADAQATGAEINKQQSEEAAKLYRLRKEMAGIDENDKQYKAETQAKMEASYGKLVSLSERRSEVEKQIAKTKTQAAKSALDLAQRELETVNSRIANEKDSLKSGVERFGMMSREEQGEALGVLQMARKGAKLDATQVGKLKSIGSKEAERLASNYAQQLAMGDYSGQEQSLKGLDTSTQAIKDRIRDIDRGKMRGASGRFTRSSQDFDAAGRAQLEGDRFTPTSQWQNKTFLSKKEKEEKDRLQSMLIDNEIKAKKIRGEVDYDQRLRSSVFGEEKVALSQSLAQRSSIEAKISQTITVVAQFENTAQQAAQASMKAMINATAPWMREYEMKMQEMNGQLNQLVKYRRDSSQGRG